MSFFICAKCKNLRHSDDGTEARYSREAPYESARFYGLICSDCMDDEKDDLPNNLGEGEV